MGLNKVLHALSWPAMLASVAHVVSATTLVVVNKVILSHLDFHFPITLCFIQYSSIALCLWFWSIFGLFKVRVLPRPTAFRLSLGSAICAILNILSLHFNSLLTYQAMRMACPPLILLLYRFSAHRLPPLPTSSNSVPLAAICALVGAGILACVDVYITPIGLLCALCSLVASALYHNLSAPLRVSTRANELQLQLMVKSGSALFMIPFLPLLDDYRQDVPEGIFQFAFDEGATILIFSTGLLAFFTFVATRASVHRVYPEMHNHLVYLVSLGILAAHFVVLENSVSAVHLLAIALLMMGTLLTSAGEDDGKADVLRRRALDDAAGFSEMDLYSEEDERLEEGRWTDLEDLRSPAPGDLNGRFRGEIERVDPLLPG